MSFRNARLMVFQIQRAHKRDAVSLTRDYVTQFECKMSRFGHLPIKDVA